MSNKSTSVLLAGDNGEFRIEARQIGLADDFTLRAFDKAITDAIQQTPGLQVNREDDLFTGDVVIRWRTRPTHNTTRRT